MNLRDRIRILAKEKGMSLPNLESKLGFGNGTIVRWDKASPTAEKLEKVADELGVSTDYLLGRDVTNGSEELSAERDIAKEIESLTRKVHEDRSQPLYYKGMLLDEKTAEFMLKNIEYALEQAKRIEDNLLD